MTVLKLCGIAVIGVCAALGFSMLRIVLGFNVM